MVDEQVPEDATVLVISRGDDEALELGGRRAWHFPQEADGTYAGSYPQDSDEAVAHLEELRDKGAQYLLVPEHLRLVAGSLRRIRPAPQPTTPGRWQSVRSAFCMRWRRAAPMTTGFRVTHGSPDYFGLVDRSRRW